MKDPGLLWSRSGFLPELTGSQPCYVFFEPTTHGIVHPWRPMWSSRSFADKDAIDYFDDAPQIEYTGECAGRTFRARTTDDLTKVHMRLHACRQVEKESLYEADDILGIL